MLLMCFVFSSFALPSSIMTISLLAVGINKIINSKMNKILAISYEVGTLWCTQPAACQKDLQNHGFFKRKTINPRWTQGAIGSMTNHLSRLIPISYPFIPNSVPRRAEEIIVAFVFVIDRRKGSRLPWHMLYYYFPFAIGELRM